MKLFNLKISHLLNSFGFKILFIVLFIFSCGTNKTNERIYKQLAESNKLLEINNLEIKPLVQQMFYKRCKHTNNFRKEVNELDSLSNIFLEQVFIFLKNSNISKYDWENVFSQYFILQKKYYLFIKNIPEWSINSYKIITGKYQKTDKELFPEVLLKMQNDVLLNQSMLYDFILFYSVCQHKPSQFLSVVANDNKLNVSSTNQFSMQLICDISSENDTLSKQITDLQVFKNDEFIQFLPEIKMNYSDTALVQAQLIFKNLPSGMYKLKGNFILKRLNRNDLKEIKNILPFELILKN
jgi:hypothetical protein